jgi:hypothetical protein
MSHVLSADSRKIHDLYHSYYLLFGEISSELQKIAKENFLGSASESGQVQKKSKQESQKKNQKNLEQKKKQHSELFEKFCSLFVYHMDLGLSGLTISSKVFSSTGVMNSNQNHGSSESVAVLDCVVSSVSVALNYQKIQERQKVLLRDGLISDSDLPAKKKIFLEALNQSKRDLILSMIGAVGTVLSVLPDPTFATKIIAAILFVGMNIHGAYGELKRARETLPMIQRVKKLKNLAAALTPDAEEASFSYHFFVEKVLREERSKQNFDPAEFRALTNTLLTVGEQLKKSAVDLAATKLTRDEWFELAERTLKFKRKLHFFNAVRNLLTGLIKGLAMSVGAALMLKPIQTLMNKISLPYLLSSITFTVTKLVQNFTIHAFFKKQVLKKLNFGQKIQFSLPVFESGQIKILESKTMQFALKQILKEKDQDLFKILKMLKTLKTGDAVLKNHPELHELIKELKQVDRDSLRINFLVKIGQAIGELNSTVTQSEEAPERAFLKTQPESISEVIVSEATDSKSGASCASGIVGIISKASISTTALKITVRAPVHSPVDSTPFLAAMNLAEKLSAISSTSSISSITDCTVSA